MGLLDGKRALILGVANDYSLAWGITKAFTDQGASVALSYQGDALKKRVEPLAEQIGADFTFEMDVTNDDHYTQMYDLVKEKWGTFDILVHSIAFADRADLKNGFMKTSRKGFAMACDISAFSLVGLCQSLSELMNPYGSVMAMTYHGSQKVAKNYNVMGVAKAALEASVRYLSVDLGQKKIRINAVSAGPVKTLAASGMSGFRDLLSQTASISPMQENIDINDVGNMAVYLASDMSKRVTGQTMYVDAGLSIMAF
jgi:enoyl-[acyl-carrier protein] reductase I